MAESGAIRAGRAFVEIFTDDVNFTRGLRGITNKFNSWAKSMTFAGLRLFAGGTALALPLYKAVKTYGEMGAEIARAAEITGTSVESIGALKYAAEQSGVGLDSLVQSFKYMSAAIEGGGPRGKQAAEALAELGVNAATLKRLSPEDQMEKIAGAMRKLGDPDEKENFAQRIFGRGGNLLIPLLDQGAAGIAKMTAHARELGIIMGSDDAQAALKFQQTLDDLWASLKFGYFTIGGAIAPVLTHLIQDFTVGSKAVREWIRDNKGIVTAYAGVSVALMGAGVALTALGIAMKVAMVPLGAFLGVIGIVKTVVLALISPLGIAAIAVAAVAAGFLYFTESGKALRTEISAVASAMKGELNEALGGMQAALTNGRWALAAKIMWTGLRLEWVRGTAGLKEIWDDFKIAMIESNTKGLIDSENGTNSLEKAWLAATDFIQSVWETAVEKVKIIWNDAVAAIMRGINDIRGAWHHVWGDDTFDAGAANAGVNADRDAKNQGATDQRNAKRDARSNRLNERRNALEKEHQIALAYINQEAGVERDAAIALRNEKVAAIQTELGELKKSLSEQVQDAKREKVSIYGLTRAETVEADPEALQKAGRSAGTFYGSVAPLLGISAGAHERTARATEKSAKHLEHIDQNIKKGGGASRFH